MSKYTNKEYNGWKVVADLNTGRKHKYFILVENVPTNNSVIFVRDNEMTALEAGTKTVSEILAAKEKTRNKRPEDLFAQELMLFSNIKLN